MNLLNSSHPMSVVRWLHERQLTMVCPEVRFPHCVGRYRLVGSPSWFAVCWNCRGMKGFLIRGWDLYIPVSGATSTLDGGATLAARWLHEPQPISNQPVGLGFPHRAGRYRPGSAFSCPGCWSCRDVEGFLTRGWESIILGCGRTSALSGGGTLAACWLHEPQPTSKQTVGFGIPHLAGRHRLGGSAFLFPGCWVCRDMEEFLIWG